MMHYMRWRRHGDTKNLRPERPKTCKVIDCSTKHYGHEYCRLHWTRWRKHGDATVTHRKVNHSPTCIVDGCEEPYRAKDRCSYHYFQWILESSPKRRVAHYLRKRLRSAIKNGQKTGSAVQDLGCTLNEFIIHIEEQFEKEMNWNNWGNGGWHLDHIAPLASFDLTERTQFLVAAHYTNYQPLWAADNIRKGSKTK